MMKEAHGKECKVKELAKSCGIGIDLLNPYVTSGRIGGWFGLGSWAGLHNKADWLSYMKAQ